MTKCPARDALVSVLKLGLIDEAQYNTAIRHPDIGSIQGIAVDPAYIVVWLVSYRIVPDESLQAFALRVLNHSSGQAFQEKSAIFEAAEQHLQQIYVIRNSFFLKILLDECLISQEEFDNSDPEFLDYKLFDSPASEVQVSSQSTAGCDPAFSCRDFAGGCFTGLAEA
ncbi:hypothetical protein [Janthinobacterium sp. 17J80-10]|uniref:hypothetical protein n=1 Tax=Janthinobacterium sp. 17J80-10 TaxID=2497863 RepID=UPI001005419F|nr:hypothetical protein [Janthinobacterium sp. 17J80-10]QAU34204.1 hypothetical protein EKL02_08400 [Janthinobacterium sp. 17J80-10]